MRIGQTYHGKGLYAFGTRRLGRICTLCVIALACPAFAQSEPNDRPAAQPDAQVQPETPPGEEADQPHGLLDDIGNTKLTLSGADLNVEVVGDQLILHGNERDLDLLEALITVLE